VAPRLAIVVLLALAGGAGAARADNPALSGTVGTNDSFQLTLADASGSPVSHLAAGTYTLVVHDRSELHNFHLFGPGGVDVATAVDTTGDTTFTVALVDGVYTFQCDPHSFSGMRGQFAVGSATLERPPPKLTAAIVGSKATLAGAGALVAGTAVITVNDRSKTDGFFLKGPGLAKKTGIVFTGTVAWAVTLQRARTRSAPRRARRAGGHFRFQSRSRISLNA
jgi:hypothetical protein